MKAFITAAVLAVASASAADAAAKCSSRDLGGRWLVLGHYQQADSVVGARYRCTYTARRGSFQAIGECALETSGDAEHFGPPHGFKVEVRRNCEAAWELSFLETICSFEGALTRDRQLITGIGLCEDFADDVPVPGTMTIDLVRQSGR